MKKVIPLITLSILLSLHVFAQTKKNEIQEKPNFNDTWILERIESSLKVVNIRDYKNYFLVISLIGDEFKIKKTTILKTNTLVMKQFYLQMSVQKRIRFQGVTIKISKEPQKLI